MVLSKVYSLLTKIPVVVSTLVMISCIGGLPSIISYLLYISYLISLCFIVWNSKKTKIDYLFYLLYLAFTIVISSPDPIFNSWGRLALFIIMFCVATPVFSSPFNIMFRESCINNLLNICVIISTISFFCYFFNINLFEDKYDGGFLTDYVENIGHFSGITKHSMLLGPISGLAVINLLHKFNNKKNKKELFLLLINIVTLFFAASRSAIIATAIAASYFFIKKNNSNSKQSKHVILVSLFLLISFPVYQPYLLSILNKHEGVETGVFDSRTGKIEARAQEIIDNPYFGVGFSSIDTNGLDTYNRITGSIEPGSSWLAIMSMTGLIGFLFFLSIFLKGVNNSRKSQNIVYFSLLLFFSVHMLAEGYIFSAGNCITFFFWLTLGICLEEGKGEVFV